MAKENRDTKSKKTPTTKETPFQKFERLARQVVRAPKRQAKEKRSPQS